MNLDKIDFSKIDYSKYEDDMKELRKLCKELYESPGIQRALKMQSIRESLGLKDKRRLKDIKYIPQEKGKTEEDLIELIFYGGRKSVVPISEIILLYNYEKGYVNNKKKGGDINEY